MTVSQQRGMAATQSPAAAAWDTLTDEQYRSRLLVVLLTATLFSVMNSSMVNVALPTLMRDFNIGLTSSVWLYTGYTLPYAVSMPLTGVLGERIGPKAVFLIGVGGFLVASLLCSVAWNFPSLLVFRILQALGAGAVIPNAMVLITGAFPPSRRGQALGLWSAVSGVGAGIGPALGGFLTQYASWHAIFWVNVPFLLLVIVFGRKIIRPAAERFHSRGFDWFGALSLTIGLTALMLALTEGQTRGWETGPTVGLFVTSLLALGLFLWWENRATVRILPIPLFQRRPYALATITVFVQAMVMFAVLLLLPIYLQDARGHTPIEAGIMVLPLSLMLVFTGPLGGRLSDRVGPRVPTVAGMALVTLSMAGFSHLMLDSSYLEMAFYLVLMGTGIGLSVSPLTSTAMNAARPEERSAASSFFNTLRFIGAVLGSTLLSVILANRTAAALPSLHSPILAQMQGFHEVYLVGAALALAATFVALALHHGAPRSNRPSERG
jgi:EmrB/QacA subfamily drug resistance transporter